MIILFWEMDAHEVYKKYILSMYTVKWHIYELLSQWLMNIYIQMTVKIWV